MNIGSIENGIVIDHLRTGISMQVLKFLNIDTDSGSVAVIMNATSQKHGKKDIIKLENIENVDLKVLGLIDHNATVIHIKNGEIAGKVKLSLPSTVTNVIRCKNPRCVTSVEAEPHVFHLLDGQGRYRCTYCDHIAKAEEY
jgi:aspartate carbamoyltransferase regulatory subunit